MKKHEWVIWLIVMVGLGGMGLFTMPYNNSAVYWFGAGFCLCAAITRWLER